MLGLGDEHVVALAPVAQAVADDGEVVRLGGARREDDLLGLRAEERGDAGPGVVERGGGPVADAVQ